jgi:CDP-diacylglycerol--serine O-phosphatidyltransferase
MGVDQLHLFIVPALLLRLARFNTNIAVVDKRFFQGLPSPAAAALIAGLVWVTINFQVQGSDISWLACIVTLICCVDHG